MKILAISQHDPQSDDNALEIDSKTLYSLADSGEILSFYVKGDCSGSVLILDVGVLSEAEQLFATLPSVQQGLQQFSLTEIVPLIERLSDIEQLSD